MKKIAIFVEGQTELVFIEKFLLEIGNRKQLSIRKEELRGGGKSPLVIRLIGEIPETNDTKYHILLRSSCNDEKVLSDIKSNYDELKRNGFEKVIGLRDLYPRDFSRQSNVKSAITEEIQKSNLQNTFIILAVMEIETWFIAELGHFSKVHSDLTPELISQVVDLRRIMDFESEIKYPANILNQIYQLVGFVYRKKEKQVQRTVGALDYAELYLELRKKLPNLNDFINHIENFFDIT